MYANWNWPLKFVATCGTTVVAMSHLEGQSAGHVGKQESWQSAWAVSLGGSAIDPDWSWMTSSTGASVQVPVAKARGERARSRPTSPKEATRQVKRRRDMGAPSSK